MRYLSVCSGIEAATVAWHPLGWTPVAFSEIEKFPSSVLAHHYPDTPNLGDMTQHERWPIEPGSVDLLVGGTPCQSFSVAGLRKGLADPRGNLALTYLAIADRLRPKWLVWENVPGVLSSSGGRDFGAFLGALGELGYGFAYRVLDAQWFGVAQRRRRLFLVGHASDWRRAAAVLLERESLRGHPAPSREAREGTAADVAGSIGQRLSRSRTELDGHGAYVTVVGALTAKGPEAMGAPEVDGHHYIPISHGVQPIAIQGNLIGRDAGDPHGVGAPDEGAMYTLTKADVHGVAHPVAFGIYGGNKRMDRPDGGFYVREENTSRTIDAAQGLNPSCSQGGIAIISDPCHMLARDNAAHAAVAFHPTQDPISSTEVCHSISSGNRQACATAAVACVTGDRTHALTTRCAAAEEDGTGRGMPIVPTAAVAFEPRYYTRDNKTGGAPNDVAVLKADAQKMGDSAPHVATAMAVRRLTPVECERLQGFPDGYTAIPWRGKPASECPDGPRYRALGNSMAVPCMRWIGERIAQVDAIP